MRFAFCILWLAGLCFGENAAVEAKIQAGVRAREAGSLQQAVAEFRAAAALDPESAAARIFLGSALLESGKTAAAIRELERAVRIAPSNSQAHFQLAVAQQRSGDGIRAVTELRKAAELAPGNAEYSYQLGRAYLQLSEWSVERIKAVDAKSARLYQILGESYATQGKMELAIQAFANAAAAAPQLSGTHLALAMLYAQSGKREQALAELNREAEVSPESAAARALQMQLNGNK